MIQQEGPGWRLAHDPSRQPFCVLIGGSNWAIELTDEEWRGLASVVIELEFQHQQLLDQMMAEEAITIELERSPWWASLEGDRQQWNLSVVLTPSQRRGAEGSWQAPAAVAIVAAMRTLLDSLE